MTEKEDVKTAEEKADTIKTGGDDKPKERKSRKDKEKPLTKIIIRRLPPTMTEDVLLDQIKPIPDYDYFYFVPADYSLGENASTRAYINFLHQEDIFIFKDKFDGYVFVDTKGAEYPAVVEFAPFQGLPKMKSRKKDNKAGTIETDQHFINFLATLNAEENDPNKPEVKMEYSYQIKDDKKITSTPLLEYIASKKQARREERRKKIEEKKKHREEEKIRKQNQIAKGIPASIQEEDDDGIIVRTIKSRPMDRDRGKKDRIFESKAKMSNDDKSGGGGGGVGGGGGRNYKEDRDRKRSERDDRRKAEREKREAARREERQKTRDELNAKRKEDRERMRKEREIASRDGSGRVKDGNYKGFQKGNAENDKGSLKDDKPKEDKVKKYSESRRERYSRNAESKSSEDKADGNVEKEVKSEETGRSVDDSDEKKTDKEDGKSIEGNEKKMEFEKGSRMPERQSSLDDGKRDSSSGDNGSQGGGSNPREDRQSRRIRNKDRPSIEIYQPGKRRLVVTLIKKEDGNITDERSKTTPNSPTEKDEPKSIEHAKVESVKIADEQKLESKDAKPKDIKADSEPKVEKKVSRYSERRNRARERRGSAAAAITSTSSDIVLIEKSSSIEIDEMNRNADEVNRNVDIVADKLEEISIKDSNDWNQIMSIEQELAQNSTENN